MPKRGYKQTKEHKRKARESKLGVKNPFYGKKHTEKTNCNLNNIIKICTGCNAIANYDRKWWQAFYTEIMRRRGYGG